MLVLTGQRRKMKQIGYPGAEMTFYAVEILKQVAEHFFVLLKQWQNLIVVHTNANWASTCIPLNLSLQREGPAVLIQNHQTKNTKYCVEYNTRFLLGATATTTATATRITSQI
jgi:hypothetical protein